MADSVFSWNEEKNDILKAQRNISFESIIVALESGNIIDIIQNPSKNHSDQKCFVVNIDSYAYIVPYVEGNDGIFLKTIYPSRKYTKLFTK